MTGNASSVDGHPVEPGERSGVLHPDNLARYDAQWIPPAADLAEVVDQYWHVSWSLGTGEELDQRIIDLPAVTATVEEGDVPAPLAVTGVQSGAWRRTIRGSGRVFAIRLRPAGLAVVSDLTVQEVNDRTVALNETTDGRLASLTRAVAAEYSPASRARAADVAIRLLLLERPPARSGLLANRIMDELRGDLRKRAGSLLAEQLAVSERTIQRALISTVGHGPKWVIRRIRLQEVARALVLRPSEELAAVAVELGYTDQSHLTADFRSVTGLTPGAYRREVARLTGV
ncbi:helix-turn-helix domain-containing protein [Amnibacterium flavum]|uniref:AraC family transcriptional regulator n=1 Tax=Amnibacterium flavum TaxID=2173173 RepID=A0A2V1HPI2_9MICO|nr:helix-turn-helix domain-containing protein [Amnibacterium flavum]PVZ94543.1 AraC family transcriptional regulator [Amnibacterium flavum]